MTGFAPNTQPEEKRFRSLDFRQLMRLDGAGRFDDALEELDRLADEAAKPSKEQVNNAFEIPRYRQIVKLRKHALQIVGTQEVDNTSKLAGYHETISSFGYDDLQEVVLRGKLGSVVLSTHPTETSFAGFYTALARPDNYRANDDQLIAAVATPETEVEVLEKLAKGPNQPGKKRLAVENLFGRVSLAPNTELSIDALVGEVTGEVGLVTGRINVEYGNVELVLREPIEVAVLSGTQALENMARAKGDVYAPLNGPAKKAVKSDFRLTISAPHGQVKVAYQPFKM